MFVTMLVLHSLLRWAVLGFGLVALARAVTGWRASRRWTLLDERAGLLFVIAIDLQTLVGLVLYGGLSPITRSAFSDMAVAMREPILRFFAVEHAVMMLLALALVHVGRVRARKAGTDGARHRAATIFFGLALLLIVAAIPWPFRAVGRPLFTFF